MIQLKEKRTRKKNNKRNRVTLSSNKKKSAVVSNDDTELPSLRLCYMVEDYETFRDSEKPTEDIAQLFTQRVKANS